MTGDFGAKACSVVSCERAGYLRPATVRLQAGVAVSRHGPATHDDLGLVLTYLQAVGGGLPRRRLCRGHDRSPWRRGVAWAEVKRQRQADAPAAVVAAGTVADGDAATVAGEPRYISLSGLPIRPLKFLFAAEIHRSPEAMSPR